MAGRIYSARATVSLTGNASEAFYAFIAAPSTNNANLLLVNVGGDFDSTAGDDPVRCRLVRVTGTVSGGSALTPAKHNTQNSLASVNSVQMGALSGLSEVSNSCVWDTYINPKDSFKPGVTIAPSEQWAIALTPGAQSLSVIVEFFWEE